MIPVFWGFLLIILRIHKTPLFDLYKGMFTRRSTVLLWQDCSNCMEHYNMVAFMSSHYHVSFVTFALFTTLNENMVNNGISAS